MPSFTPATRDLQFVLHDLLAIEKAGIDGFEDMDPETVEAILTEAGKLATEVLAPLNQIGDQQGCRLENGVVYTPEGFKDAYEKLCEGGWTGLDMDPEYGGQGMPYVIHSAVGEMHCAANMALNMYSGLTHGAASTIHAHGTEEQKQTWLPKMISGAWGGTMNLTEPHCGTDLGLMRTRAEPQEDGSYRITGQKIFISAGEHDLTENIVHLVLAKAPGGGKGTKGVSLFIVPKVLVNEDGSLGARNAVSVGSIERKMGIHGNATCVMNYDGAKGWLLGELHRGMPAMFTMMNEARLGVGLQGYAQAALAHEQAATYARERLQGRAVTGAENPEGPADPLIVHPDIRRMLMDQKSFVEGARALTLWGAFQLDRAHRAGNKDAEALVSLLTPVIKGFLTDKGFEMAVSAQQILGGHGYIEEWGMSQIVRDARIAMIYEGANGIQALDLVGRKLALNGGKQVREFFALVQAACDDLAGDESLAPMADTLGGALKRLQAASGYFAEQGMKAPNDALSGATDYMHLFGHVALGLMWAQMARAAHDALAADTPDRDFYAAKLATARYYMARQLPATSMHAARIRAGGETVMALPAEAF
ncbi:MAG: acyl-CoA dehydrogenase C-terminal domain-containing protein [Rhodobacteraceae bacterium]|nr:acyl-CoA dehydrogenase C-terminal domain-containing protein [Paracoccaceae bacterium]